MLHTLVLKAPMKRGGSIPMRVFYRMDRPEPRQKYGDNSPHPIIESVCFVNGGQDESDLVDEPKLYEKLREEINRESC